MMNNAKLTRISINLATMKPTALLALFNRTQLKAAPQEMEDTIVKIMREAAED